MNWENWEILQFMEIKLIVNKNVSLYGAWRDTLQCSQQVRVKASRDDHEEMRHVYANILFQSTSLIVAENAGH